MLPRLKLLLLGLPCLLFNLAVEARAQNGRLFGSVILSDSRTQRPATGVRVIAVGGYVRTETRTDNYGNFGMVLPSGKYRISGQAGSSYTQRMDCTGYVRPYTDSYIFPNPLVLEYKVRFRSSGDEISSSLNTLGEGTLEQDTGVVIGLVTRKIQGRIVPVNQAYVQAIGAYGTSEPKRTNRNGFFELKLRAGTWKILVLPIAGFHQREPAIVTVKRNERIAIQIELVPTTTTK